MGSDIYDIYLLHLSFYPEAVVGRLVKKIGKRQEVRRNTQNKKNTWYTKQKTKIQNKHKRKIKNISRIIKK